MCLYYLPSKRDTGGSERFRAMTPLYYRDAAAAIITYDVTQEKSFKGVKYWVEELSNKGTQGIVLALAANKSDVYPEDKKIQSTQGKAFADEHGMMFGETSAKTGAGVSELFKQVAQRAYNGKVSETTH
jgi:small GTP-binding protein